VGIVIDGLTPPTLDEITLSLKVVWTASSNWKRLLIKLQVVFADVYLFCFTITAARLSLVFLYQRIFGIYRWLHRMLWVIGILSVAWLINSSLLIAFRCKPTSAFWDPLKQNTCLNINTIFVATESINCGLDLALVLLPLTRIRQLHLSLKERVALGAVFLTGALYVHSIAFLRVQLTELASALQAFFELS
jgi:hypothetical protein